MQVKKQDVKQKIVEAAKKVFKEKGFEKASIRGIAAEAGVTKGNIYTYFGSKDELFLYIVEPALAIIIKRMTVDYEEETDENSSNEEYVIEESKESFKIHMDDVINNREIMELLFFSSGGSKLSNFKEQVVKAYAKSSRSFYEQVEKVDESKNSNVTDMFIHSCAMLYINFVEEILLHNADEEENKKYIEEMTYFVYYGTKGIMEISNKN